MKDKRASQYVPLFLAAQSVGNKSFLSLRTEESAKQGGEIQLG